MQLLEDEDLPEEPSDNSEDPSNQQGHYIRPVKHFTMLSQLLSYVRRLRHSQHRQFAIQVFLEGSIIIHGSGGALDELNSLDAFLEERNRKKMGCECPLDRKALGLPPIEIQTVHQLISIKEESQLAHLPQELPLGFELSGTFDLNFRYSDEPSLKMVCKIKTSRMDLISAEYQLVGPKGPIYNWSFPTMSNFRMDYLLWS